MATILVIDDEKEIRDLLRAYLEEAGHQVLEAPDGVEALRGFDPGVVDLVITDVFMPEKDGIEVIVELHRRHPNAPVLAISGGSSHGEIAVFLDSAEILGAARTLEKPFSGAQLLEKVQELLASRIEP